MYPLTQIVNKSDPSLVVDVASKNEALIAAAIVAGVVSLIVGLLVLVGTLISSFVLFRNATAAAAAQLGSAETAAAAALSNARTAVYSTTVTAERSKWINALRADLALLSGKLRTLSFHSEAGTASEIEKVVVSEVNNLIPLIRMQLNPFGKIEKNIAILIDSLPNLAGEKDGARLRDRDDLLIEHCRWLLKAEWDKVKREAGGTATEADEADYLRKYDEFCDGPGKMP